MSSPALKVVITGAAGQIAYSLITLIARGAMFGENQRVILQLLEIEPALPALKGLIMELEDCAYPLLEDVITTCDPYVAFNGVDVALLVGSMPRRPGMERKELLKANVGIFKVQGAALDKVAKKSVKVLVVGNPANTNCFICSKYAPSIPKENFSALTRLDHNRALSQLALKMNVPVCNVRNAVIWGNHSNTQFADASHATVTNGSTGANLPVATVINDEAWLKTEFLSTVQKRGAAVLDARKASSALSAAKAIVDHMHDWWFGTSGGRWVSMAVFSDGSYGVPNDLIFSFPVTIDANTRQWSIVKGLEFDSWASEKKEITTKELVEERADALSATE